MLFEYVNDMGLGHRRLIKDDVYSGNLTPDGRRVQLDNFPREKFYPNGFLVVNDTEAPTDTGLGMKFDGDKPRMELLVQGCPNALEQVGTVLTFGAKKYAAHSWQTVPGGDDRYLAALLRHLTAIGKGEQNDPESGLSHLAHAACNALFILELECRKKTGTSNDAI